MRQSQLQDLLVATLVRRHGGTARGWRMAVGAVRLYDPATHPHCNWAIDPRGSTNQIDAIEHLLDELRGTHPLVTPG